MRLEIRKVEPEHYDSIRAMIRAGNFSPRRSWPTEDPGEMACSGLREGVWQGVGIVDESGVFQSYLDYKPLSESEAQIGFIVTAAPRRRCGLASRLIDHVRGLYPSRSIVTTTSGRNRAMRSVLERAGFQRVGLRCDRLNGDCTAFYRLPGPRGASWPISGAICVYNWSQLRKRLAGYVFEDSQVLGACPGQGFEEVLEGVDPNVLFFLPHVDLTDTIQVPLERDRLTRGLRERGVYILNEFVTDISKRRVQQTCARFGLNTTLAQPEGEPGERLIVKTDRNYAGGPEGFLSEEQKAVLGVEDPTHGLQGCQSYIVTTRCLLNEKVFDDPQLVIERYIDNQDSLIYRAYVLGDRLALAEVTSPALIKKMTPDVSRKNHFLSMAMGASPEDPRLAPIVSVLTHFCEGFGLDFGTIDVVKDDFDRYYIIDVNPTPGWRWPQLRKSQPGVVEHLAGARAGNRLTTGTQALCAELTT